MFQTAQGVSSPQSPNWTDYLASNNVFGGIRIDIDTSNCGFTSTPHYIVSMEGSTYHWQLAGLSSIYNPTPNGFTVFIRWTDAVSDFNTLGGTNEPNPLRVQTAKIKGWSLKWTAIQTCPCDSSATSDDQSAIGIHIGKIDDKLSFNTMEDFINAYNYLENKQDLYLDSIDAEIDEDSYEEDLPLMEFEKSRNFTSLRAIIEQQVTKWLDNEELDEENDPDEHEIDDDILRTLVTPEGKVIIGGKEYNLNNDNLTDSKARLAPKKCKLYLKEKKWFYYDSNNKKVKLKGTLRYYGIKSTLKAKVKSFKKKRNGKWKKHRTRLFVQSYGKQVDNRDGKCSTTHAIGAFKGPKNRKKLAARYTKWGERIWLRKSEVIISCTVGGNQLAASIILK